MEDALRTAAYIAATVLFILSLRGLSSQETARRGNLYGILGMAIAILATLTCSGLDRFVGVALALVIGGSIGLRMSQTVAMTAMPQLVALLHSFVGLAAVLVGFAT
ncbi:MAG: NAD(P)(+) transhydrogenase (Re/Si-specific) subunit beta, partial [Planctomycetota bacterium]